MSVEVVQYKEEDITSIIELVSAFHKEVIEEYGLKLDREKLFYEIEKQIPTSFFLKNSSGYIGVLGGKVIELDGLSEKAYHESVWYVKPGYRKYGIKLVKAAEQWARENGCTKFLMVCMHNSKTDKLFKFYERIGMTPLETHFIKELR